MEEDFIKVVKPETEEKRLLGLNDDPEKSIRIVNLISRLTESKN